MKHEFKWILSVELEMDEDRIGSDNEDIFQGAAEAVIQRAQESFFDDLNNSLNEGLKDWKVLEEELK